MNNEDIYKEWKQNRRQVTESIHSPSQKIMDRIYEYEQDSENIVSFDYLTEIPFIVDHYMRYAAAIGLSALGFYRVFSVTRSLLVP
ncbi:MAG: hypothetical protein K8S13_21745 [Desulfobacula sp.]|uniref:hypothetical protein n=1 Tax=Desulfobacula sp. TaxID=2593537 RepID=UPI0025B8D3F4|nr:hypothetical protein [Desulfobacula sp.]MCD4722455.1 hypothetical protein [Desulfobacula sp.]